jgi:small conductance mechanosensitive channel
MAIFDLFLTLWSSGIIFTMIKVIVIIVAAIFFIKIAKQLLINYLIKARDKKIINETIFQLFQHIIVALLYFIGLILIISSIPQLNSVAIALVTGAGLTGIIVGLAAQNSIGNIVSGISLAIFQPFRVGDFITIHNEYGKVTDLGLRHTVITTWDNRRLIIPNSIISEEAIINWSIEDPTVMWPVDIGISYDSDIDLARSIMIEEAENHNNVMKLPEIKVIHPEVREGNEIKVIVTQLGDFAVNMKMLVWVRDRSMAYITGCELNESIKKRFDVEGVEIPFPYRTFIQKRKSCYPGSKLWTGALSRN